MNIYIIYEKNVWPFTAGQYFTLESSLFGAVRLTTYFNPDKCKYFGYGIEFDTSGHFSLSDVGGIGKNVINIWC